ncbi:sensor histidine kinase [Actinocorallia longicatena]|uniref:Anti-sigma factor RsbA family regulatory protein n=1 Tax=Actinocorallia longicatena TaxID=111803 RepID=A0ABP6QI89_9ACTN
MPALLGAGRDSLIHQALLYGSETEFTEEALAFLAEGRGADDALVVIAPPDRIDLLRPGLPPECEFREAAGYFTTPPRSIATAVSVGRDRWWKDGGRVRVVAEQVWKGRDPVEVREWKRFEALVNVVFAGTRTSLLCAYDLRTVPSDVMRIVERTHHGLDYEPPARVYAELDRAPLLPQTGQVAHRGFVRGELPGLRDFTAKAAAVFGLTAAMPLIMAVNEVATNIIKHGGGSGSLLVWSDGGAVICDLLDPVGRVEDRFLGFLPPSPDQPSGAGMWMVRQLCDLVEIRSGGTGTIFRLTARLP